MLDLGAAIGRQHAHDVVYDAAQAAAVEGKPFSELVARLNKSINAALAQPELRKRLKELGYEEWTGAPQKLAERGAKERAMWATVTQGIVVD